MRIQFKLDGVVRDCEIHPGALLSELLAELGKEAGPVLRNGLLCRSERMLAAQAQGCRLVTPQGVERASEVLETLRECGVPQSPEVLLSAHALLQDQSWRQPARIEEAFLGLLAPAPVDAVQLAGQRLQRAGALSSR